MTLSLYQMTVPVFVRGLENLDHLIAKAERLSVDKGQDAQALVGARLAPDMFTLAGQVQSASDAAKFCAGRLAAGELPSFPDNEATLEELHQRIRKTIAYLEGLSADVINARIEPLELKLRGKAVTLSPQDYVLKLAIPNFFFHVATAHGTLRNAGIDVGKSDYLGPLDA